MFNNLFLNDVVGNRNKRQQLDHLLRITAPHERIILASIGAILLMLVVWVLFGSITRSLTVDGVLLKPGIRHEVVSAEPGYLVEFLVAPGSQVEVGDPIARQTVPELEREIASLRSRIEALEAGIRQVGGDSTNSLLVSAQKALLQTESRRAAKETIVSPVSGEVMVFGAGPGDYLPVGSVVTQLRHQGGGSLQAVLQVAPRVAKRLDAGMRTSVEMVMPDGTPREVGGKIVSITSGPLPNWLAVFQAEGMGHAYRVDIALHPESALAVPDGTPCRVRIVLGQHSPVALLGLD